MQRQLLLTQCKENLSREWSSILLIKAYWIGTPQVAIAADYKSFQLNNLILTDSGTITLNPRFEGCFR